MLTTIRLRLFKKFADVTVHLRPFTVLMGENSSGKTTVLQAINLASSLIFTRQLVVEKDSGLEARKKGAGMATLPAISLADHRDVFYGKAVSSQAGPIKIFIDLVDDKGNIYVLQIQHQFGNFNVKLVSTKDQLTNSAELHKYIPLYISGSVGLRSSEERSFPLTMQDKLRTGKASEIIRNIVLDTKQRFPKSYEKLETILREDFDFHLSKAIKFEADKDLYVSAFYNDVCNGKNISLDFNSSGSGFMQVLQILATIFRYAPNSSRVVLLDEPDAHLHPNLQKTLAKTLRKVQQELDIQIIISTHSTAIIREADPSEVIPVSSNNRINIAVSTKQDVEEEILTRIDTFDLAKSVISGKLVFIEDANTKILEKFDEILGTRVFKGANTIPVIKGIGRSDKLPFRARAFLKQFVGRDIEVHFIMDNDGLPLEWQDHLNEKAKKSDLKLHQLHSYEIENYVLQPNVIMRALEKKHIGKELPSLEELTRIILQIMSDTIAKSRYGYERGLTECLYQTSLVVNGGALRYGDAQSEAIKIRERYEESTAINDLLRVAQGKETLKAVQTTLQEKKIALTLDDILACITEEDVPQEFRIIFEGLRSQEVKPSPATLPILVPSVEDDDESLETET